MKLLILTQISEDEDNTDILDEEYYILEQLKKN